MATSVLKSRVAVKLGSLSAINTSVAFGLGDTTQTYEGTLFIVASGGAVTTPTWVLEASLDQGTTWFILPATSTSLALTGLLSGDTAALFAGQYTVSGLSGALFKFGATAGSAWTATNIYALVG